MRLTLRTLLAYLDDTLPPDQAKVIGEKVAESDAARELIDKIKRVTRKRSLSVPGDGEIGTPADANAVAEYLNDVFPSYQLPEFEQAVIHAEASLAEVAACHQILTLLLTEPVRVPPSAKQRMYGLVKGREALPNRKAGRTAPVAGELPDHPQQDEDDADTAFLLGMKAYSRTDSVGRRARMLGTAGLLAAGLVAAGVMAWPAAVKPDREPVTFGLPAETAAAIKKDLLPEKKPDPAPAEATTIPEPRPTAPVKPVEPEKGTPPANRDTPPSADRATIGVVETPEELAAARTAAGKYERVSGQVFSTDRLVSLPGYKTKLKLDTSVGVELWGHLPEQAPGYIPVLESAVTFAVPPAGFDADVRIHSGRVYIAAKKPTGARVRLRVREQVWDLSLPDDKGDAVVEVVNALTRGVIFDLEGDALRQTTGVVAVLRGTGTLTHAGGMTSLKANELAVWSHPKEAPDGPTPVSSVAPFKDPAYFSRYQLPTDEARAKAAAAALKTLAGKVVEKDGLRVALLETVQEENAKYDLPQILGMRTAVFAKAALEDLPGLVEHLCDPTRPFLRDAAASALNGYLAAAPTDAATFRERVAEKFSLTPAQTALSIRLLRGCNDSERTNSGVVWPMLIETLGSNQPLLRELAFGVLKNDVDPEARVHAVLGRYDAFALPEIRTPAAAAWKKRIDELAGK